MTIEQFLGLFSTVKDTRTGWLVCCPSHDDRSPSLAVMEGQDRRIVLNCLAHCEKKDIMAALGRTLADLFPDHELKGRAVPVKLPPVKQSKVKLAFAFELHALDLKLQAEKIFEAAKGCTDCATWSSDDREIAMKAVSKAYAYLERASFCDDYADHLREQDYESKQLTSRQP